VTKQEHGDWQTPLSLAHEVLSRLQAEGLRPRAILEPTCGEGSFLVAAAERFPEAELHGYERSAAYVATARARLPARARVTQADFFGVDWERALASLPRPLLVTGNPPWVTSATLGALGSANLPPKSNFKGLRGLDARTGKSNFDVSEWMLLRLVSALAAVSEQAPDPPLRRATLAVLCKTAVARRVIEQAHRGHPLAPGALFRIDCARHFRASVDAALLVAHVGARSAHETPTRWPVHDAIDAARPVSHATLRNGALVHDEAGARATAHLEGICEPAWRSGLKHDCARVMELTRDASGDLRNGLGAVVDVEPEVVFPLLKSAGVARGDRAIHRAILVPQRALDDDPADLSRRAPRAWRYLEEHRVLLRARKSSIYRGRPDYVVFGVGPYSFAPWKVAISGLYKRAAFTLVGPVEDRPVFLDDTCYFLPFDREAEALAARNALRSPAAQTFFSARVFADAKRPWSKSLLQQLDLAALFRHLERPREPGGA